MFEHFALGSSSHLIFKISILKYLFHCLSPILVPLKRVLNFFGDLDLINDSLPRTLFLKKKHFGIMVARCGAVYSKFEGGAMIMSSVFMSGSLMKFKLLIMW